MAKMQESVYFLQKKKKKKSISVNVFKSMFFAYLETIRKGVFSKAPGAHVHP